MIIDLRETELLCGEKAVQDLESQVLVERFESAPIKIAVPKRKADSGFAKVTKRILMEHFGLAVPEPLDRLISVSEDGSFGFFYTSPSDMCRLVAEKKVDRAIVGLDTLIENYHKDITICQAFPEYNWDIVAAVPKARDVECMEAIRRVATKYTKITAHFFSLIEQVVEIEKVTGAVEAYPYLNGGPDAIVDVSVTGTTLRNHYYRPLWPPIAHIYPVLIGPSPTTES